MENSIQSVELNKIIGRREDEIKDLDKAIGAQKDDNKALNNKIINLRNKKMELDAEIDRLTVTLSKTKTEDSE